MSKRVRISNDRLNSYGTRVLTAGMNVEQYCRNPVLLYQHERGKVIGYVKDLKVENGEVTGELMFDEATELSKQCKKQYEFGSLRMVSVGIDILELSEDKELLVQGQTSPTVTKSKLYEVSLVDIGSNDDALVLRKDGMQITLGKDGESPLPSLNIHNTQNSQQMELKTLALQLGLPETADEAAVNAKLTELNASKEEAERIRKENDELKLAQITSAVDAAVAGKKITADKKQHFLDLGKQVGIDMLNATLEAMSPQVKISQVLEKEKNEPTGKSPWEERMAEIRAKLKK